MFLVYIIAGWMSWGFTHYWLHRYWHAALENDKVRLPGIKFIIEGEYLHHTVYDHRPPNLDEDTTGEYVTFPLWLAAPAVVGGIVLLGMYWAWAPALQIGFGAIVAMLIDDQAHKRSHPRMPADAYREGSFLSRVHDTHHDSMRGRRCEGEETIVNFAFCSGIIWDVVFGTWESPMTTRRLSAEIESK